MSGFLVIACLVTFFSCSSAPVVSRPTELEYSYSRLKLLDIDEMNDLILKKVKVYRKTKKVVHLEEALMISLSRPNDDNILEKLINTVRFSLETNDEWEGLVESVVDFSVSKLKNETTAPVDQVTYLTALSNLLLEFKPEFYKPDVSPVFEKNITDRIADANIIVSDEARKESSLNSMYAAPNPSELAQNILQELAQTKVKN
jgi:hypothetical protein